MLKWLKILPLLLLVACGSAQEKDEQPQNALGQTFAQIDGKEVIPLEYRTIYIHLFDNRSYEAQVVARLKEKLQIQFNMHGRLKVEAEKSKADVFLYGRIERFKMIPATYDQFNQITQYLMSIIVSIRVRVNTKLHKVEDDLLLDRRVVKYQTRYSPRVAPFENMFVAQERLLETLSNRVVYTAFEGWYSDLKSELELNKEKNAQETKTIRGRKQEAERREVDSTNILNLTKPDQR